MFQCAGSSTLAVTPLIDYIQQLLETPLLRSGCILIGALLAALFIRNVVIRLCAAAAQKTQNEIDDQIIAALRQPLFYSVLIYGISLAVRPLDLHSNSNFTLYGVLKTCAVMIWANVALSVGSKILERLSSGSNSRALLQKRTLPLFRMLLRATAYGIAIYFVFLAWDFDVTAWLASAGIVGIVVGFAAQDTLANLIAGIFIIADAPYRVGDFVILDGGTRGQVTNIGFRSTRVLTLDDVEIIIPNSVIGKAKIANETGGPHIKQRISVSVDAAYGSDIAVVREALLGCPKGIAGISAFPRPVTRFEQFGGSGLSFALQVWISEPATRDAIQDLLRERIYNAFLAAKVEIPYSKHDVYIKAMPGSAKDRQDTEATESAKNPRIQNSSQANLR